MKTLIVFDLDGHEIAGVIEKTGSNVGSWGVGQRVRVGWFGGADGNVRRMPSRRLHHVQASEVAWILIRWRLR